MEIENGIPLPDIRRGQYADRMAERIRSLNVGQSFYVADLSRRNSVNASVRTAQRATGARYAMRSDAGGFRVWRVE